jgi:hypothetical protein
LFSRLSIKKVRFLQNFQLKSTSYWQPFLTPTALANREVNFISYPNARTGSPEFSACISVSKNDPNDENETGSRGVVCLRQNQAPFFFLKNIKIASKFAKFASKSCNFEFFIFWRH